MTPETPIVRVHGFKPGQLEGLRRGVPIRTPIGNFLIKNASWPVEQWYPEFKALGGGPMSISNGMTGHQVLRDYFWSQGTDGIWRKRPEMDTRGTGTPDF